MKELTFMRNQRQWKIDFQKPIDLSLPVSHGKEGVNCFYAPPVNIQPVVSGTFIGSIREGGSVNHHSVTFTPHGNCTHTECVGHIATVPLNINDCLGQYHFFAKLISLIPHQDVNGNSIIEKKDIKPLLVKDEAEALIIRTLPNPPSKRTFNYSGTNPPYFEKSAIDYIVDCGINHLLTDLPSVDQEEDGGKLISHRAFWNLKRGTHFESLEELESELIRYKSTITELIFVPDEIQDGYYLLNLQVANVALDASPGRPVLFQLIV